MNESHQQLKSAFAKAFAEMQKSGISMKKLDWFKSETQKDALRSGEKNSKAA